MLKVQTAALSSHVAGGRRGRQGWIATPDTRPLVVDGLEANEVSDGMTVYDTATDRIHYLNPTAAIVFSLCDSRHTSSEIAGFLGSAYGLDDPPVDEVESCLRTFGDEGLLR
jgi:hypothetical protein